MVVRDGKPFDSGKDEISEDVSITSTGGGGRGPTKIHQGEVSTTGAQEGGGGYMLEVDMTELLDTTTKAVVGGVATAYLTNWVLNDR